MRLDSGVQPDNPAETPVVVRNRVEFDAALSEAKGPTKSGKKFTSANHEQAWRLFKVRPLSGGKQPANTNKDYCIYHSAHRDYTYSEKWVDFLATSVSDDQEFAKLKAYKL